MSQRHDESDPILDAAQACVLAVGVRRTTMTDVAKRAGVSRMTLYRRFPDVTSILQELMTREFSAVIEEVLASDGGTTREQIVRGAVRGADVLADHPLFRRLLEVDPELLLPYLTDRVGAFQAMVREACAGQLAEGMADGSVRVGNPAVMAATLELALRGYVFGARAQDPGRNGAELARMLDGWLAP
jgi:AcrR family transcriptional regulator